MQEEEVEYRMIYYRIESLPRRRGGGGGLRRWWSTIELKALRAARNILAKIEEDDLL